jgi:hypothetical protein
MPMALLASYPVSGPPRPDGPHVSAPAGWAMILGFLSFTALGMVLYLIRLAQAAT